MKNGLVTSGSSMGSRATSPGSPWHSLPYNSVHLSPPAIQPPIMAASSHTQYNLPASPQPPHQISQSNCIGNKAPFPGSGDSMESSPECSENFSPPTSPGLQNLKSQQTECRLMDEVDRGELELVLISDCCVYFQE